MILADKIIENRKKLGWSQEELAARLDVSRQSVSKWESAQAVPDMKKILALSEVFGVSTDYLLRDELDMPLPAEATPVDAGLEEPVRSVSMEEANDFLKYNDVAARKVSTGVMLCILSPVLLILLAGLSDAGLITLSDEACLAIGVAVLLVMVASGVGLFLMCGLKGKRFEYLEQANIDTQYGVTGLAKELRSQYADTHSRRLIIGILLCILAAIPLLVTTFLAGEHGGAPVAAGVCVLLVLIALGVKLIVLTCMIEGGFEKLLEEGDYTRANKRLSRYDGIYWAIVLAIYLGWSFVTMRWEFTWIVWPVAGVLYAAYREIIKAVLRAKQ